MTTATHQAFTLLNPGPINVSDAVRAALAASPDQCHRELEYLDLQDRVRAKLVLAFGVQREYEVALLTGSGTAAMEAMVGSVVKRCALVISNGVYGDRLTAMCRANGILAKPLISSWFERPELATVEHALSDPDVDTLAVVHHETTTGLLNDVPGLARLAREKGKRLIVDSVSGLGGEAFDFADIRPDAVCSTANKCVQGLPGMSFVWVRRGTPLYRRSVYLDLDNMLAKQRVGDTPFTPAVQVTAALEVALDELMEETVAGRIERYAGVAKRLRAAIEWLGLELLVPTELRSNTITCAELPKGVTYDELHDRLRAVGFVIYAGQGDLRNYAFRVANMGLIPDERVDAFGPALEQALA